MTIRAEFKKFFLACASKYLDSAFVPDGTNFIYLDESLTQQVLFPLSILYRGVVKIAQFLLIISSEFVIG